jgi:hypothetical protein
MKRVLLAAAITLLPAMASASGNPPAEQRVHPYIRALPACGAPVVLGDMSGAFASREANYWNSTLAISGFDRVSEKAFRPWGQDFVPQRFCTARGHFSDGKIRQVTYRIRETIHVFGNSWEVIWCVNGLDRHSTYAPACEQATHWN